MTELAAKSPPPPAVDARPPLPRPAPPSPSLSWLMVWAVLLALAVAGLALTVAIQRRAGQFGPSITFVPVLAMLICLLAAGHDGSTGRIPNPITYTAILIGLGINSVASLASCLGHEPPVWLGAVSVGQAFLGFGLCAVIGILCLVLFNTGGGDVKLLAAFGALLGSTAVTQLMLWTLLIAVPYALVNLLIAGRLNAIVRTAASHLLEIVYLRQMSPVVEPSRTLIPMALPMLIAMFAMRTKLF